DRLGGERGGRGEERGRSQPLEDESGVTQDCGLHGEFSSVFYSTNKASIRDSSQRARRCATTFARWYSGAASGFTDSAASSSSVNSLRSCLPTDTDSAKARYGAARRPFASSSDFASSSRARSI